MADFDTAPVHVKVTINDLYKEQQETNKLLIQLASELKNMSDLPDRVSKLEISTATNSWLPKVVWTALSTSIIASVTAFWQLFKG
jgi:hypothetical protein